MMTVQKCYLCKKTKPLVEFTYRRDERYYRMCKDCVSAIISKKEKGKKKLKHTKTHRTCYLCVRQLPVSEFTRRSNGTYFSACKECNKNVFAHRRRARLLDSEGTFTTEEWESLLERYDKCPQCKRLWDKIPIPSGRKSVITRDHIAPISKGGSNSIENIQPLCYSCNSSKGDKECFAMVSRCDGD
jgi:5-methylcytosine-specific restriction endonuclease McrA